MTKVYVKENWSEQFIQGDSSPGFFVGRKHEISFLKHALVDNDSSTILISSVRGVGKTSFVHKTIDELANKVKPIFVNIGHAITNNLDTDIKREVLVSLIRTIYLSGKYCKDGELEDLYKKSIGKYEEYEEDDVLEEESSQINFYAKWNLNRQTIIRLAGVVAAVFGAVQDIVWLRYTFVILGFGVLFLSLEWVKSSGMFQRVFTRKKLAIENTTSYLEIKFEEWLKKNKGDRIVFIIDELDKLGEINETLGYIKEYKNLFTRSFAHFIFIADHEAFKLTMVDRKDSEKGIFPTFFTHTLYLPLPKTDELKQYLLTICKFDSNIKEELKDEFINYLLFRSGNDFFDLKRLIADIIDFEENNKIFIDIDDLKKEDTMYSKVATLFEYVERFFIVRNFKKLKKSWKDNSDLQTSVFDFLNRHFNKNFICKDYVITYVEEDLVTFLTKIGILTENNIDRPIPGGDGSENETVIEYQWTGRYKRNFKVPVLESDKDFQVAFDKLVDIANVLDDLPAVYEDEEFTNHKKIVEGYDGEEYSKISAYSTYKEFKPLYDKMKVPITRVTVTTESTKDAKKAIDEQIKNITQKYFDIINNILKNVLELGSQDGIQGNFQVDSGNFNTKETFNTLPGFLGVVTPSTYETSVWCNLTEGKYVLLIRYFEDESHITNALEVLRNNKNLLIINIMDADEHGVSSPSVYKDKAGSKRKKGMIVDNFINFKFNDFRQFTQLIKMVKKHLEVD